MNGGEGVLYVDFHVDLARDFAASVHDRSRWPSFAPFVNDWILRCIPLNSFPRKDTDERAGLRNQCTGNGSAACRTTGLLNAKQLPVTIDS